MLVGLADGLVALLGETAATSSVHLHGEPSAFQSLSWEQGLGVGGADVWMEWLILGCCCSFLDGVADGWVDCA